MKNREQIRAKNALDAANNAQGIAGPNGGEVTKKAPALIMNHGLLAAASYSYANDGYKKLFNCVAAHLAHRDIGIVPQTVTTAEALIAHLTQADSLTLRIATTETQAWLQYARRFISRA